MLLQRNSQRRLQSSTRIDLARDLHDSLAQDLVAIGFQLDLLIGNLPIRHRAAARQIRLSVTDATLAVRKELFALRKIDSDYQAELAKSAGDLKLKVSGELSNLDLKLQRIVNELVKNAATHSKGHNIQVEVSEHLITVKDDGQGLHGVSEVVRDLGGTLNIASTRAGTQVEIRLP